MQKGPYSKTFYRTAQLKKKKKEIKKLKEKTGAKNIDMVKRLHDIEKKKRFCFRNLEHLHNWPLCSSHYLKCAGKSMDIMYF